MKYANSAYYFFSHHICHWNKLIDILDNIYTHSQTTTKTLFKSAFDLSSVFAHRYAFHRLSSSGRGGGGLFMHKHKLMFFKVFIYIPDHSQDRLGNVTSCVGIWLSSIIRCRQSNNSPKQIKYLYTYVDRHVGKWYFLLCTVVVIHFNIKYVKLLLFLFDNLLL